MTEGKQKYELLALFPLTATEEELRGAAAKVAERLTSAGAAVFASAALFKGYLAYPIAKTRQGYYHTIQFELEPLALAQLRRDLTLAQETLRFSITKVNGKFRTFMPSAPRALRPRLTKVLAPAFTPAATGVVPSTPVPTPSHLAQEAVKPEEAPKVTMEEIDKRLEEILGESR